MRRLETWLTRGASLSRQNEYIDTQSSFSVNDIDQNPTWCSVGGFRIIRVQESPSRIRNR